MQNKMTDLRNHLFETLEALKDKDAPLDLARAKTIAEVAQVLINSAKVEVQFIGALGGGSASDFFASPLRIGAPDTERPALQSIAAGRASR
jgi:phosphoheptose isomerase